MIVQGFIGKKCGMTQWFTETGRRLSITVIQVLPNRVTQVKTMAKEGYSAVQVTTGTKSQSRVNKPMGGHFAKAKVLPGVGTWEFALDASQGASVTAGTELTLDHLSEGQWVDISGLTKGRGFAGVIKRYHFSTQNMSHGNSISHRKPGSTGQRQTPGRVFKGKKMPGHLGQARRTIQSQQIIKIDKEQQVILLHGAVPGPTGGMITIRPAVKKSSVTKRKG